MKKVRDVDTYIAEAPFEAQPLLHELREIIKTTVPEAEEGIWYGVPFYKYFGEFVGFDAFTKHINFGFGANAISDEDRKKLEEKGYKLGKLTLQIKFDQKIPVTAVKKMLKTKARANKANPGMNINLK